MPKYSPKKHREKKPVPAELKYFVVYKPFGVICQFSDSEGHKTLKDCFSVPKDVYPVGRLDTDSEGLLILTNDNAFKNQLLSPKFKHHKTYWVQIEGNASEKELCQLENGVEISIKGKKHQTLPAKAKQLDDSAISILPERFPPIRFRKEIPDSWIQLTISEGKNRQVRRMTAKVGLPTLRLVRYSIEKLTIKGYKSGEMRELDQKKIYQLCMLEK